MMEFDIDMSELEEASQHALDMVTKRWPKENNKWMRKQGRSGRAKAAALARQRIKNLRPASKDKSSYMHGMTVGKPYHYLGDPTDLSIQAKNTSNHGHLVEYGHVIKPRGRQSGATAGYRTAGSKPNRRRDKTYQPRAAGKGRVPGYHILEDANKEWQPEFEAALSAHVDELLEKGLW